MSDSPKIYTVIGVTLETRARHRNVKADMIMSQIIPVGSGDDVVENKLLDLYEEIYVTKTFKGVSSLIGFCDPCPNEPKHDCENCGYQTVTCGMPRLKRKSAK